MDSKEQESIIIREEIKERAREYWEARRILENFDKVNDLIAHPIMEAKTKRVRALVSSNKCSKCTSTTCNSNLLNCFNQMKRDARAVYHENLEWFLENGVTMEEIKKYA